MGARPTAKAALEKNRDKVIEMLREGQSQDDVAEWLGVSQGSVHNALRQWGIDGSMLIIPKTPQAKMLARRVRELEQTNAAAAELAESVERAARSVAIPAPELRTVRSRRGQPLHSKPVDVVFHVSDLQYGMRVHPSEVPGGDYSPAVFEEQRLPRFISGALALLELVALAHPIRCVWFAQGGDMVEGDKVFKGQEWHLAIDAGTQIARLAPLWAQAVATISAAAKRLGAQTVSVLSVVGNHGVNGGRGGGATPPALNYDFLLYEMVRHALAGMTHSGHVDSYDRQARSAVYFDAQGSTFLLSHGDQDRGGGIVGFAAVNGMRNDVMVRLQTGLSHRYHLKGHYHKGSTLAPGGDSEILWNGSWEGPTNLSVARGGGSEPMQRVHVVHPDYGRFIEWPIRLAPGMSRENLPEIIGPPAVEEAERV